MTVQLESHVKLCPINHSQGAVHRACTAAHCVLWDGQAYFSKGCEKAKFGNILWSVNSPLVRY